MGGNYNGKGAALRNEYEISSATGRRFLFVFKALK